MTSSGNPAWVSSPPSAYDIVACWYPLKERPDDPGPVLRPVLVTTVQRGQQSGLFACRVAFGTKQLKIPQRRDKDIIVQNTNDIRIFGLARATRFDLDTTATLPWTPDFFGCWTDHASPLIGSLTEPFIKEYAFLMMLRDNR